MSNLITLTKIGIFDQFGSRTAVDSESIRMDQNNISSIETDASGSIVMLATKQALDGGFITGYVVSQTPAQIQTLIDTTASTLAASDGTVGAPSVTFSSDTDSGFYYIGANNFGVATNGTKVMDIGANQILFNNATDSTTTTTGAVAISGGLGIAKALFVSTTTPFSVSNTGVTSVTNATDATSSTTGSIKITGGAGVAKNLHVGGQFVTNKNIVQNHTPYTTGTDTTAGWTLTEVKTGLVAGCIKTTSAAAVTLILDSVANIITSFGTAGATITTGSILQFVVDNSQGANTVTVQVDAGATIAVATPVITGGATLTLSTANKIGVYQLYLTSATTAILSRIV